MVHCRSEGEPPAQEQVVAWGNGIREVHFPLRGRMASLGGSRHSPNDPNGISWVRFPTGSRERGCNVLRCVYTQRASKMPRQTLVLLPASPNRNGGIAQCRNGFNARFLGFPGHNHRNRNRTHGLRKVESSRTRKGRVMLFDWLKTYWRLNWPSIVGVIMIWITLLAVLVFIAHS